MAKDTKPEDQAPDENERPGDEADESSPPREELEEALREKDQFRSMAQRAQADLINFKRRAEEERDELRRGANSRLLLKILSVVDDLGRAIDHASQEAVAPSWFEGLRLVQRNLKNVLVSESVTKIEAEGQPFEPWGHEAVYYEESDNDREGMVVRVIREGYKLHDRVLRAAQVTVSKAPQNNDESNPPQEET